MAKVDWITWKTDPKELIDKEKIESDLNNKTTEINSIMDNLSNSLKLEVEKGGLNKESLHINGETPGNEVANKILNKIEVIKNINTKLNNKIMDQANKQKQVEKEQLITAIEEKVIEQEKILENTKALRDRLTANNGLISSNEVESIIHTTEEKITMLKERLERAKAI